jgi:hypothetical protein
MAPIRTEKGVQAGWPDARGTWTVETMIGEIGGRLELIGLSIQPQGEATAALTSTVLKQLSVPQLLAGHLRFERYEAHFAANDMRRRRGGPELSDEQEMQILMHIHRSYQKPPPRTGRPTHWNAKRLAEVARVYQEAWRARKHPTKAVASRFHLTASGAAKVVKLARTNGSLPPTSKGKAGWIEVPGRKGRKSSKGRKR